MSPATRPHRLPVKRFFRFRQGVKYPPQAGLNDIFKKLSTSESGRKGPEGALRLANAAPRDTSRLAEPRTDGCTTVLLFIVAAATSSAQVSGCRFDTMRNIARSERWYSDAVNLAQGSDRELVTFDRGFRSFSKLALRLLVPAG